jgi:GNAT superfamily N-acetyltransferase
MRQDVELIQGDGQSVLGVLCSMNLRHLQDVDTIWQPMLKMMGEEDAFWDWAHKKRAALSQEGYEAYAIEYENLTQGLLWIETRRHRSWSNLSWRVVYVEALASAPWNRRLINPEPYLKGIGRLLLQFARSRSLELGYGGRVGLHALSSSASFYESQNMMNGGSDPDYNGMVYFEYGPVQLPGLGEDEP